MSNCEFESQGFDPLHLPINQYGWNWTNNVCSQNKNVTITPHTVMRKKKLFFYKRPNKGIPVVCKSKDWLFVIKPWRVKISVKWFKPTALYKNLELKR